MLWVHAHESRGSRALSTVLSIMLVLMLVSPGVAAFADETSSTPVPVPVELVDEPEVPEVVLPEEVPVEVEVPDVPADEPVEAPVVMPPSEEVLPVTVDAAATVIVLNGARSDFPAPITVGEGCELMTIATFWAGQHTDAGTVSVWHDDTNVYVKFETTGGWTMGLTHLYVGLSAPGSYAPGSFPYQTAHNPQVTSFTYTISLASLGAEAGDTLYIAAHAEVHNGQQSETAWAGQGQWPGLLFTHMLEECEPVPADITVIKFNDLNENGELDEGEPFVEGVEITIEGAEEYSDSALTDSDGEVVFGPLFEGTYVVDEILPAGWFATVELPIEVELAEGQDQTVYIGNAEEIIEPVPADITVIKFNDLNENGELDEGEPFVEGVEITIEGAEEYSDSALTDSDGEVVFGPLFEGTYVVDEILPAGWFATVELPIEVELAEGQDQTVYIGNAEEFLPFTFIDLAIVKEASVSTASAGDIITYTLTYRNLGNTDAMNFVITDDFDERYVGIVDAAGGTVAGGEIMWSIPGPLGPEDGPKTITYSVRVINDMPEGITDIQNTVVISHPDDVNLSNNMDDATVRVDEPFLPFTPDPEDEEPFLPFTGGESNLLTLLAGFAALAGLALRRVAHVS